MSWYHHMDWAKHMAVAAAFIAGAGLLLSGWGTHKSVQVADDQLKQTKEAQSSRIREQATRVTTWQRAGQIIVANRSLDPVIAQVSFEFYYDNPVFGPDIESRSRQILMHLGTVPPCQKITIHHDRLKARGLPVQDSPGHGLPPQDRGMSRLSLLFIDAAGRYWNRGSFGLTEQSNDHSWVNYQPLFLGKSESELFKDLIKKEVATAYEKAEPLEECGVK